MDYLKSIQIKLTLEETQLIIAGLQTLIDRELNEASDKSKAKTLID